MGILLYLPWFRLTKFEFPLPVPLPGFGDAVTIQPFGILMAAGTLFGVRMAIWFARRSGIAPRVFLDWALHALVLGFIFSPLVSGIFYYPDRVAESFSSFDKLFTTFWGLSSFGGFLGGILGSLLWSWRRGVSLRAVGDIGAFSIPFGWAPGRLGCAVVHDHPGRVTDFPLAFADFQFGSPPYEPRHDLGFYEFLWWLVCIAVFLGLARTKRPQGLYLALLPLLYAPARFFLDFLRVEPASGGDARYAGLTPAQYGSIALVIVGTWLLRKVLTEPPVPVPPEVRWPTVSEEI